MLEIIGVLVGQLFLTDRFLKSGLSVGAMLSVNNINKYEGNTNSIEYPYLSVDGYFKYSPLGGKFISPYILAGYGMSSIQFANPNDASALLLSRNASKHYLGGFGLDFELGEAVALVFNPISKQPTNWMGRHYTRQV